jgi:radical SAM superfamily enzyme
MLVIIGSAAIGLFLKHMQEQTALTKQQENCELSLKEAVSILKSNEKDAKELTDVFHDSNQDTVDDLKELREHGMEMIYIGAESGSDQVLAAINKGVNAEQLIEAVHKIEYAGIKASVTFISGIAGKAGWREHAIETGKMVSRMNASYVALLTLMLDLRAPITQQIQNGELELLSPEEVVAETCLMLEHMNPTKPCVFRSNHASNYLSLKGDLPKDRDKLLAKLQRAMKDTGMLKDERFRML